jgi:hypothetical protein
MLNTISKLILKAILYKFFYCECVDEVFNYPNLKLLIQIFLKTILKLLYKNETKKHKKNMNFQMYVCAVILNTLFRASPLSYKQYKLLYESKLSSSKVKSAKN